MEDVREIWKDIPSYEGYYQVSNLGRVKSLERVVRNRYGDFLKKESILKSRDSKGYYCVVLCKNGRIKNYKVHKLVAMAFLNHKPCGMKKVVHHIDNNKMNNKLSNLEIISQRENSYTHCVGTSKYTGVSWCNTRNKWISQISINNKTKFLGYFTAEIEASIAYQNALNNLV